MAHDLALRPLLRRTRLPALMALLLAGPLSVALIPPATAAPGDTVTLVGSLQSELGCAGDWQTDCLQTRLVPVAGSPEMFRATFDLPAGDYEYKVVINESFAENYGAGGAPGGANISITSAGVPVTFTFNEVTKVISDSVPRPVGAQAGAHWLTSDTLAWELGIFPAGTTYRLYTAADGGLRLGDGTLTGGTAIELKTGGGLTASLRSKYPHLGSFETLTLPRAAANRASTLLKGELAVAAVDPQGRVLAATGVQIAGVLDTLYARAAKATLGLSWTGSRPGLALWAPTARDVTALVYAPGAGADAVPVHRVPMRKRVNGVWVVRGDQTWKGASYRYEVEVFVPETGVVERNVVTDPYSVGLTTNSTRSLFVDLADPDLAPVGWRSLHKPKLPKPEDLSIYELHVRDFSISDTTVAANLRGTYLAFTDPATAGMRRLHTLASAGLNAVHLLPVNDMATVNEVRGEQRTPACELPTYAPASDEQQRCVGAVASQDGYNWGYDPLHYTTPEGSYATNPEDATRIREFRAMVAGLNGTGLRVIQDVVYNHTSSAGQSGAHDLDRIVPGYYHRLNPTTGAVETSTCCPNTATENTMMGKLVVDSVVTLAKTYKLDGFRFDLMGHHPKQNILDVRAALDKLTVARDGVNGKKIYLYGEGWEFGEVAGDARFIQATQDNMAGTGVGTFNDRLRDGVRGGTALDEDPLAQGFASGLFTDPSGAAINGTLPEQRDRLLLAQDWIKVGLAGNLQVFPLIDRTGAVVTGAQVDYQASQPATPPIRRSPLRTSRHTTTKPSTTLSR